LIISASHKAAISAAHEIESLNPMVAVASRYHFSRRWQVPLGDGHAQRVENGIGSEALVKPAGPITAAFDRTVRLTIKIRIVAHDSDTIAFIGAQHFNQANDLFCVAHISLVNLSLIKLLTLRAAPEPEDHGEDGERDRGGEEVAGHCPNSSTCHSIKQSAHSALPSSLKPIASSSQQWFSQDWLALPLHAGHSPVGQTSGSFPPYFES
jgi:hypothetical protein